MNGGGEQGEWEGGPQCGGWGETWGGRGCASARGWARGAVYGWDWMRPECDSAPTDSRSGPRSEQEVRRVVWEGKERFGKAV